MTALDVAGVQQALDELAAVLPDRWYLVGLDCVLALPERPWRAVAHGERGAALTGENSPTMADAVRSLTARVRREFHVGMVL